MHTQITPSTTPANTTNNTGFQSLPQSTGFSSSTSFVASCNKTTTPRHTITTSSTTTSPETSIEEREISKPFSPENLEASLSDFFTLLKEIYVCETVVDSRIKFKAHLRIICDQFEDLNSPEAITTIKRIIEESKKIIQETTITKLRNSGTIASMVEGHLWTYRLADLLNTYGKDLLSDPCSMNNLINFGYTLRDCLWFNVDNTGNLIWMEQEKKFIKSINGYGIAHYSNPEQHDKNKKINSIVLKNIEHILDLTIYQLI